MTQTQIIRVEMFGEPEVMRPATISAPVAGPGEVVIEVAAADVIFLDTLIRSGRAAGFFPVRPPYVPGNGVAGTVTSAGAAVGPGIVGQRVVARTGGPGGSGGYAAQVVVPAARLIPVPDEVEHADAAALLHDGATALRIAELMSIGAGDHVLILGAAGGMGLLLVQLARAAGARVTAAARGKAKLDVAVELGAEAVVDYGEDGWTDRVAQVAGRPDVVLDGVGGALGAQAFGITAAGGRFSAHGAPAGGPARIDPGEAERSGVTIHGLDAVRLGESEHAAHAARALAMLAAGQVRPYVGQTFPLASAAAAHAAMENRAAIGKSLLLP